MSPRNYSWHLVFSAVCISLRVYIPALYKMSLCTPKHTHTHSRAHSIILLCFLCARQQTRKSGDFVMVLSFFFCFFAFFRSPFFFGSYCFFLWALVSPALRNDLVPNACSSHSSKSTESGEWALARQSLALMRARQCHLEISMELMRKIPHISSFALWVDEWNQETWTYKHNEHRTPINSAVLVLLFYASSKQFNVQSA